MTLKYEDINFKWYQSLSHDVYMYMHARFICAGVYVQVK